MDSGSHLLLAPWLKEMLAEFGMERGKKSSNKKRATVNT